MRRMLMVVLGCLALAVMPVGAAVIVESEVGDNVLVPYDEAGALEFDLSLFNLAPVRLTVDPDAGSLSFNSLITILTAHGAPRFLLELGGGATWESIGSIAPISSSVGAVIANATQVSIALRPPELFGLDLGDVGFGGTDWRIDTRQVTDVFTLTLQAVPEPSTPLLLGMALVGLIWAGRRRV